MFPGRIEWLADAEARLIESTSCVSPSCAPQMADHAELMARTERRSGQLSRASALALLLCALLAGCGGSGAKPKQGGVKKVGDEKKMMSAIEEGLKQFQAGKLEPTKLTVIYSDLHGLHGGLELEVSGDGKVRQQAVRAKVQPASDLGAEQVQQLVGLLIEQKAWEQRVPERTAVPDESRARLTIQIGGQSTTIWEWYNDLSANDRMVRVREKMKDLAWKR